MIAEAIRRLVAQESLSRQEAFDAMSAIMEGEATPAQIAAFVTALRMKGETSEEVCGLAQAMREHSLKVPVTRPAVVDTCGTGGARLKAFNISTTAAFIAAGAGAAVAKHGNRAASSSCGSADVLEALGVEIDLQPEQVGAIIDELGVGFLFARTFHPAMKHAAGPRREIGIRTVFNILGPLTNPAGAKRQVVGVFEEWACELLAGALLQLGAEHALVVHGREGIDEIATFGETLVGEVRDGDVNLWTVRPQDVGLKPRRPEEVAGGDPARNAGIFLEVLAGGAPAAREIACLNAGAALYVSGLAESLEQGLGLADRAVSDGAAREVFESYRSRTQAVPKL